jgi:alkanesulfonate monooxygenase SsuD/methylene tetrahydromethanopterin reductase-like flavin-dependent oxidoreductase (luciferase family)
MKLSFLQPGAYASRQPVPGGWPVPPEFCDREAAHRSMEIAIEQCRLADDLGFDWISVSEHHYAPRLMTPNPIVLAAALTQVVKRAKLALLGPLLPMSNPVRIAEEIAMFDAINGGRTVVLFLRGTAGEHLTYGADPAHSREMTQEAVELILRAWTEPQPFGWQGRYFQFRTVSVWPRTLQEPHPPVYYSGNSLESAEFAARHRLGMAMSFLPRERAAEHIAFYKRIAHQCGWEPTREHVLYRALAHVAPSDEEAQAATHGRPAARDDGDAGSGGGAFGGIQFLGGPETVLHKARGFHEAGVGVLDLAFSGGNGRRSMELFAAEVMPALRELEP